jgi:hypothetical protein
MQYLLQQTRTVAKIGIFYGLFDLPNGDYKREELTQGILNEEDAEIKGLMGRLRSQRNVKGERLHTKQMAELGDALVANGYYYLNFNRDRLLRSEVVDGKVVMGEAEFEALIFFRETHLPVEIMRKLAEISGKHVPILFIDSLPTRQSGFKDWETNDITVKAVCQAISQAHRSLLSTPQLVPYLRAAGIEPQLRFGTERPDIGWIQKRSRESRGQLVMVRNRTAQPTSAELSFPGLSLQPYELVAMTGTIQQVPFEALENGDVHISVPLEAYQSRVIGLAPPETVSRYPKPPQQVLSTDGEVVQEIVDWHIELAKRNVDGTMQRVQASFEVPQDWRDHPVLRTCSGPAEYRAEFNLDESDWDAACRCYLDFERVCDVATVTVNGTIYDPLLLPPWQVDVTDALKPGLNCIQVTLETTYRNLLVGYGNQGSKRYKQFKKQTWMPSGLVGKVTLRKG